MIMAWFPIPSSWIAYAPMLLICLAGTVSWAALRLRMINCLARVGDANRLPKWQKSMHRKCARLWLQVALGSRQSEVAATCELLGITRLINLQGPDLEICRPPFFYCMSFGNLCPRRRLWRLISCQLSPDQTILLRNVMCNETEVARLSISIKLIATECSNNIPLNMYVCDATNEGRILTSMEYISVCDLGYNSYEVGGLIWFIIPN